MTPFDVVRKAIPDASDSLCDMVLWERTCFPIGAITARVVFEAADRLRRAGANGIYLCDFCDHKLEESRFGCCASCSKALATARSS